MRMQFGPDDEDAFWARRDDLAARFADWLSTHRVPGDPDDARLLLDWKWGYGDGALDGWAVGDVREFLFSWCPRKLSASPQDCTEIPASVAAFVEFLAHTGLLGPGSDRPSAVRGYCESSVRGFVREMGNPANFGMAKSLLGGLGFDDYARADELNDVVWGDDDDDDDPPVIGPVRLPTDDERLAAVRAAPVMGQLRLLAEYCAAPGRTLTGTGNLRLADARHLVDALATGDEPEAWGTFRSAADLPVLSRLVDVAVGAGVVRRQRGRLLAVARFAALDELAAHDKVVRAAVDPTAVEDLAVALLFQLLGRGPGGVDVAELVDHAMGPLGRVLGEVAGSLAGFMGMRVTAALGQLADLGLVTVTGPVAQVCSGCGGTHETGGHAASTAAGVSVAVDLAGECGITVLLRPDPESADAASIAALVCEIDASDWVDDATAWLAVQPDRIAAGHLLVGELTTEDRSAVQVLAGLETVEELLGDGTAAAVRAQLGGPHDGIVAHWLLSRSELDPATLDPTRFVHGLLDVLAAVLDAGDPADFRAMLEAGERAEHLDLMDRIWRVDHPRLPDVLDAIGAQHPVKAVAKAARKARMRYASRVASR